MSVSPSTEKIKTSLTPEECIVVEDTYAGIDDGIAGGMITVGIDDVPFITLVNLVDII